MDRLTRLTDRAETEETDCETVQTIIKRYGMWGTMAEVEVTGRKIEIVYSDGKREEKAPGSLRKFKSLAEAEERMKEIVANEQLHKHRR